MCRASAGGSGDEVRPGNIRRGDDILSLLVATRNVAPAAAGAVIAIRRTVVASGEHVYQRVVLDRVFVHLASEGGVAGIAAVGVGRSRDSDIIVAVIRIHIDEIVWIVVIHQHGTRGLPFAIWIQVACAKNGTRHVVAVGAIRRAGFIGQDAPFEINVGLDVSIVSMAHYDARAIVGAAPGIGDPDCVASVVFGPNHVFGFCGRLLLLDQGDVGMAGEGTEIIGRNHRSESAAEVFQDLTLSKEMRFDGTFAGRRVVFDIDFPMATRPHIVRYVAGV